MTLEFPRRWKATVEIKDLLSSDDSPENAIRVGSEMARRLRSKMPADLAQDPDLEEILAHFETVGDAGKFALSAFNATLDRLYDWADEKRVWLGTL